MMPLNKTSLIRYFSRILKIVFWIVIFNAMVTLLNYIYTDPSSYSLYRFLWHDYNENKGTIENIYLGSSHVYMDINSHTMDELSGLHNFNMSSPSQPLNGSYYLLKQADHDNDLSNVYLELYYMCSVKDNFNKNLDVITNPTYNNRNWQNIDFMNNSWYKLAYIKSCLYNIDYLPDIFFPFIRYREKLGDWNYVKTNLETKSGKDYRSYHYYAEYTENGYCKTYEGMYVYSTRKFMDINRLYNQSKILDENPMGELSEAYLKKIIVYCQQRDIPIILFISPMDNLQLISTVNYDNYVNQVREIASEYNVPFYDFNLIKQQYLELDKDVCFHDIGHLNAEGAALYTPVLYKVLTGSKEQNASLFYSTYAEKLANCDPDFYGLYYRRAESEIGESIKVYHIASNREDMEYRIIITPEEGEQYWLQDFDTNASFTLPASEDGICTIVARMKDNPEEIIQTMEINL